MSKGVRSLSSLPAFDKAGDLWVIIETPKGSSHKYDYDPDTDVFDLAKTLPEGMTFPYDFGFVPSTLADDGDPLDVLVLIDQPAVTGCRLKTRLIGGILGEQRKDGEDWLRNDRLLAVVTHSHKHQAVHKLHDLRPGLLDEIVEFFAEYNKQEGRTFKALGKCNEDDAMALVEKGIKRFKKHTNAS